MSFFKPWLSVTALLATSILIPQHAAARQEFYSQLESCPVACSTSSDPSQWTLYSSLQRITRCNEPTLFDVSLSSPIKDGSQTTRVRACTAGDPEVLTNSIIQSTSEQTGRTGRFAKRNDLSSSCPEAAEKASTVGLAAWGQRDSSVEGAQSSSIELVEKIKDWVQDKNGCQATTVLGHFNGTIAGYLGGAKVDNKATANGLIDDLATNIKDNGVPERLLLQHCGKHDGKNITGGSVAGIIVATENNFGAVQEALRTWSNGECLSGADETDTWSDFTMALHPYPEPRTSRLQERQAECEYTRVEDGDSCGLLAERCGISDEDYMDYNDDSDHCSTLTPGQAVCCSSGSLPDLRPDPNEDGTCFSVTTDALDTCSAIAATYGMKPDDLFPLNENTWGWIGCDPLPQGLSICVSEGDPPMPAPVDNAVCGPTKPGSKPPKGDRTLSDLNPCPLKVCCNIWGQCGTTEDFCIIADSETGAPGSAPPESNGCIQNCGMDIVNNDEPPEKMYRLGYFEAWNHERDCLHMDVRATGDHHRRYTDIHFAFAEISEDFNVVIPENQQDQFEKFVDMEADVRKTLAFGGWDFSTLPDTFEIFRNVVKEDNRAAFAQKCVDFAVENNLDGLDFDWEYPGAPDIPGIDPGLPSEGPDYLAFLQEVRDRLPDDMTLSIAAPASFWYLKGFPIDRMEPILDYIVYMTYDLHGQWDFDNNNSISGCPAGNCLRSHVNWTETTNALSMITKAGVPASKILIGVSSYGRSFKMADPNCKGPMCTFLGDKSSPAKKGRCTDTNGYISNAEILEILDEDDSAEHWYDEETRADYMIYEDVEWVSYLSDDARKAREGWAFQNYFGGTIEWAIDLAEFLEMGGDPEKKDLFDGPKPCDVDSEWETLEDLEDMDDSDAPENCIPVWILQVLQKTVSADIVKYRELLDDGYDESFKAYARAIQKTAPKALEDWRLKDANDYLECKHERDIECCDYCENLGKYMCDDIDREFCETEGEACDGDDYYPRHNVTVPKCPDPDTKSGNWTYAIKDGKEDEFYEAVLEDVGLRKEDIRWESWDLYRRTEIGGTIPTEDCKLVSDLPCRSHYYWNVPKLAFGFGEDDITNPKDTIEEALDGMKDMPAEITGLIAQLHIGYFTQDWLDIIDAVSLPVLMAHEAVKSMEEAHEIGQDVLEDERKNLILLIVQAALFIIPFIGKAIGTIAGAANLARMLSLVGDVGLIAVDVYKIVDDPEQAPILVMGILITAAGGLGNWNALAKAAIAKRTMKANDLKKMGGSIASSIDRMSSLSRKTKEVCPRYA